VHLVHSSASEATSLCTIEIGLLFIIIIIIIIITTITTTTPPLYIEHNE